MKKPEERHFAKGKTDKEIVKSALKESRTSPTLTRRATLLSYEYNQEIERHQNWVRENNKMLKEILESINKLGFLSHDQIGDLRHIIERQEILRNYFKKNSDTASSLVGVLDKTPLRDGLIKILQNSSRIQAEYEAALEQNRKLLEEWETKY